MRISDWSSDVCSSDLGLVVGNALLEILDRRRVGPGPAVEGLRAWRQVQQDRHPEIGHDHVDGDELAEQVGINREHLLHRCLVGASPDPAAGNRGHAAPGLASRSEEHTSELQSLMRISYAVFCLKKKN